MSDTETEPMNEWPEQPPSEPPAEQPLEEQPTVDQSFDVPDPPQTGDVEVDAALLALAEAISSPLEEQVAVYEAAHRTLQDRLADVEG
jgi:hypothetical protein